MRASYSKIFIMSDIEQQMRYLKEVKETLEILREKRVNSYEKRARKAGILLLPKYSHSEPSVSQSKKHKVVTQGQILGTITHTESGIKLTPWRVSPENEETAVSSPIKKLPSEASPFGINTSFFSPERKPKQAPHSPYSPIGPSR